ncbi:MAG TPA: SdrD B-like domain-containing protein, partial [Micromonosporaceae bacterium]
MARVTGLNTTRVRGIGKLPLLCCALFVFGTGSLQAQTPPGTVIRNLATVTYQAATGASFAPVSDSTFVTVGSASGIAVTLVKSADRASGTMGDTVTYSVVYQGLGAATATNVIVSDVLPAGTVYVPASITLHGAALTDVTGDDAGSFTAASRRVAVTIPAVTGSDSGTITFRAQLTGAVSPTNVARVDYLTPLGADSAFSNSIPTTLLFSSISVAKLLDAPVAPAIARVGDAVQYRIRYDNPAAGVTARNVVVTDTLPAFLQYVTSNPPAAVSGSVLTWTLGDIAAGTTADITVQTQVSATLPDSMTVVNGAALALDNGPAVNAVAPPVLLLLAGTGQIALAKVANVLETGLGEAVPYTLTVQNLGTIALSNIQISDRLPEGGRYSTGSATGVDSVSANGRDIVFYVAGPVAPGALYHVHYQVAIVSTESSVLQNTAVALADAAGTPVQSQPATAWVRIRHAWPLETRAAIGRVFDDANHNGVQDNSEAGIAGVDVWTDDGEISTTDAEGRFSFQNLRPGRHVYRIDPATLPAGFNVPSSAQFVARDGSGWTSPRVNFALGAKTAADTAAADAAAAGTTAADTAAAGNTAAQGGNSVPVAASPAAAAPAAGSPAAAVPAVASPAADSLAASSPPLHLAADSPCGAFDGLIPGAHGDRAIVAYFNKNESRPLYVIPVPEIGARVSELLKGRTGCAVDVVGHTDTSDVHGGPFWSNQGLSDERARWVAYQLRFAGLRDAIVDVVGHAALDPLPGFGLSDL